MAVHGCALAHAAAAAAADAGTHRWTQPPLMVHVVCPGLYWQQVCAHAGLSVSVWAYTDRGKASCQSVRSFSDVQHAAAVHACRILFGGLIALFTWKREL